MTTYKLVMPGDMNHYGFLFGGKMLMWVDEVAWIAVSEDYPTLHFVTVGMSKVEFKKSVHPQSVLRFDTQRQREGRHPGRDAASDPVQREAHRRASAAGRHDRARRGGDRHARA